MTFYYRRLVNQRTFHISKLIADHCLGTAARQIHVVNGNAAAIRCLYPLTSKYHTGCKLQCVTIVNKESEAGNEKDISFATVDVNFEDIKSGVERKTIELIDVRNTDEVAKTGLIPGSKVVPLPELSQAFELSEQDFKRKYGFTKPTKEEENLVILCRSGVRAAKACKTLVEMGYLKVKRYPGSWLEWVENHPELKKEMERKAELEIKIPPEYRERVSDDPNHSRQG